MTNANLAGQQWTSNGSPYIVDRDLFLYDPGRWEVGPGVEVLVSAIDRAASGSDSNRIAIVLNSDARLHGTPQQPIIFRALSNDVPSTWSGLHYVGGVFGHLSASNVFISRAVNGIYLFHPRWYLTAIDRVTVATNDVGIRFDYGDAVLNRVNAFNNSTGFFSYAYGTVPALRQCLIHDNTHDGIVMGGEDSGADFEFNTIHRNGGAGLRAIGGYWTPTSVRVRGCVIVSNSFGIRLDGTQVTNLAINFCNVFGNSISNYLNVAPETNCISAESKLLPDLRLRPGSPCIDLAFPSYDHSDFAGYPRAVDDPATPNRGEVGWDGTFYAWISDIGAYEFQPLRIQSVRLAGANIVITFNSQPDEEYELQVSDDFQSWTANPPVLRGSGEFMSLTNSVASATIARFHRIALRGQFTNP